MDSTEAVAQTASVPVLRRLFQGAPVAVLAEAASVPDCVVRPCRRQRLNRDCEKGLEHD